MYTKKFFTFLLTMMGCAGLMSNPAAAQDVSDEFEDAMSEAGEVADWDTNNDGVLDSNEFYVVNYRIWDADHDGMISMEEWNNGIDSYIPSENRDAIGNFNKLDTNNNDSLDINEYTMVMVEADPYEFELSMDEYQKQKQQGAMDQSAMQAQTDEQTQTDAIDQDATVMIWQMDNDNLVEKITYGDWSVRLDEDNNKTYLR